MNRWTQVATETDMPTVFASAEFRADAAPTPRRLRPSARRHRSMDVPLNSMVMSNPPEHTRLRRLIGRAFTPQRADGLRTRIASSCDQVPESDRHWLANTILHISDGIAGADETRMTVADGQTELLDAYFRELAAQQRREPCDDLISTLVATPAREELVPADLFGLLWLLWLAGTDSTAVGLIRCVWTLVAEVLRQTTSTPYTVTPRPATRDITVNSVTYPAHAAFPDLNALNEPQWGGLVRDPAPHSLPVALERTR